MVCLNAGSQQLICRPYSTVSNQGVTYLEEDMVFEDSNDDPRVICDFQPVDALDLDAGATATIQSIVDLASTDAFMGDYVSPSQPLAELVNAIVGSCCLRGLSIQ